MVRERTSDEYYTQQWMLELPPVQEWIKKRIDGPFMDTNAGEGNWLFMILLKKIEHGIPHKDALEQLFGVELQSDSVQICREKLLMGNGTLSYIVEKNIVCADSLRYHYRFDGTPPIDPLPVDSLFVW